MGKLVFLRNIFFVLLLIVGVYFVANFGGQIQSQLFSMFNIPGGDVQGVSTQKAEEISSEISANVNDQVETATDKALQISIGDALSGISRLQKIPQDLGTMGMYVKEQVDSVLQSREQNKPKEEKK